MKMKTKIYLYKLMLKSSIKLLIPQDLLLQRKMETETQTQTQTQTQTHW